jgi:hypothetical protein
MRYRALLARRCSIASFTFDMGNTSIIGATLCRAENSSIRAVLNGLPNGVPEIALCAAINGNTASGKGPVNHDNVVSRLRRR